MLHWLVVVIVQKYIKISLTAPSLTKERSVLTVSKSVLCCSTPFDKDIIPLYDYLMAALKMD